MENKITMIEIEKLIPHPQNPRLDIGDVSELAESIKANGVLQNLTVVPVGDKFIAYRVIIGHRRLAASKIAGLKELPCVITEMTEKEQLKTMLIENIQREGLDPYEQAQGFQMMIDMGESIKSIVKDSGFSESTVRHRLKMAELNKETLKKSVENGITLFDLIELEKVKDVNKRNEILEKNAGTNNFNNALRIALEEQELKVKYENWKKDIKKYEAEGRIKKIDTMNWGLMTEIDSFCRYGTQKDHLILPDDDKEYCYIDEGEKSWKPFSIVKEREEGKVTFEKSEDDILIEKKKNEAREHDLKLRELAKRCDELRFNFYKNFTGYKEYEKEIQVFVSKGISQFVLEDMYPNTDFIADMFGQNALEKFNDLKYDNKLLLFAASALENDTAGIFKSKAMENYSYWIEIYDEEYAEDFKELYSLLESIGYKTSDDERQLIDGTHPFYKFKA